MSMQVNKWFNQETGLAPIDPKALERVKVPQPSFKNVFITGTVSKVIGPTVSSWPPYQFLRMPATELGS
jgi:hypothetical protein